MSAGMLKRAGKASAAVLKAIIAPFVGREDFCDAVGYIENAGVPAAVIPDFVGQKLFDTTNNVWYRANAVTAGAWVRTASSLANPIFSQPAPAAKAAGTTLTAAELLGGLITGNLATGAAGNYQLPLGADLETALDAIRPGGAANNDAFDFALVNISAVALEDITLTTNAGWTLVGNMVVASNDAAGSISAKQFRVRRTGDGTFTIYSMG